jgi:NAD(P)-dependent dehydrogenase (short-subunit alcohol dehydrogenase family)
MSQQGALLSGQHALITGAGTGIGAAIATALAQAGVRVSLAGRRAEPLEAVAAHLADNETRPIAGFDITEPAQIAAGLAVARAAFGPIDILVNNAGEAFSAPFAKTELAAFNRLLAVNLTGTFLVTRQVIPDMVAKRGGRVINIASTAGLVGYAYVTAYVAAKHGVIGLTRGLALEFAKSGITVNAVCPGYTDTPLLERAIETIVATTGRSAEAVSATLASSNPQGRVVLPHEVADSVLWLASPGAAAITGQAIVVGGGEVMVG